MKQSLEGVKVLLLDIEGTVCPISFVKETLFPYALKALPVVLEQEWETEQFRPYKEAFPVDAQKSSEALLAYVRDLTARDVKVACLKNLQGYLWESGYKTGAYATPLFDDITAIFSHPNDASLSSLSTTATAAAAAARDLPKVIYSSGSIFAQKLLFAHSYWPDTSDNDNHDSRSKTDQGEEESIQQDVVDLTPQISAYHDTTTAGSKTLASSYEKITQDLKTQNLIQSSPAEILFLSDNVLEIKAALEAGLKAVVVDRPGNAPLSEDDRKGYEVVTSFEMLDVHS